MSKLRSFLKQQKSTAYSLIVALSVASLLIANTIAGKSIPLWGDIAITSAVIVFPLSYILSSVVSEVYGYQHSRFTCWLSFAANLIMVGFYELAIVLPAASFYGNQDGFAATLGNSFGALFASLTAYVCGDWIRDKVFDVMKMRDGEKGFTTRAVVSAFAGELIDSLIFIPLLRLLVTGQPLGWDVLWTSAIYAAIKAVYELIISPLTKVLVRKLRKYEGME